MAKPFRIEYFERPGRSLDDTRLLALSSALRACAGECFESIPEYQCLSGTRMSFEDKVITVARDAEGRVVGFCSAVILPVRGVGNVLHLGLTCVAQSGRSAGLTHALTSRLVTQWLIRRSPLGRQWISNVACVLSSLGNVALNFGEVYPAPDQPVPSRQHRLIGETIQLHYRDKAYVRPDAVWDPERFVFRGSVKDTVFQKRADDTRYHHRDPQLNRYYQDLLDFDAGDEALQVGHISLLDLVGYVLRRLQRGLSTAPRRAPKLSKAM
jgi:hypothetical protein